MIKSLSQACHVQIDAIVRYLRNQEKSQSDCRVGVELEHFILDRRSLEAVSYYGESGVGKTLEHLLAHGWQSRHEGEFLLGLERDGTTVTLEPGAQIELSVRASNALEDLDQEYLRFLSELIPILESHNQILVAMGYQPQTKIEDIPFIPKSRYEHMSNYLRSRGRYALNMMKGTASMQVTVDYTSESDYALKFRIANGLVPVVGAMFDNAPFFENELCRENGVRMQIWNECDAARCGTVRRALAPRYGYADYAEYLLDVPPIIFPDNGEYRYTGETPFRELFDTNRFDTHALEHMLSMVFPDVRTKKYIEIRMIDAVPYPLSLSGAALWKGIMYNPQSLERTGDLLEGVSAADVTAAKSDVIRAGLKGRLGGRSIYDMGRQVLAYAADGLEPAERDYLAPLEEIFSEGRCPADITRARLNGHKGRAIDWCVLNPIIERLA